MKKIVWGYCLYLMTGHIFAYAEYPNFTTSMQPNRQYKAKIAEKNQQWCAIINSYKQWCIRAQQTPTAVHIPKIIHQIWLGSPFPPQYEQLQKTWIDKHPDWDYHLWTDAEVEAFLIYNKAAYHAASNYGEKSDIARYEILYRLGGLYVDTDFECIALMDIFHHTCTFYAGVAYDKQPVLYNGLIGCMPGHPVLKQCIDCLQPSSHASTNFFSILQRTGPAFFTRCFFATLRQELDVVFPLTFFYPLPEKKRNNKDPEQLYAWVKPETHALHHWHAAWNGGCVPLSRI